MSPPSISSRVQSGLAGAAVSPDNEKPGLLNRNRYILVIPKSAATYRLMWSNEPLHLCRYNASRVAPILLSVFSKVCFPPSCVCMCLLDSYSPDSLTSVICKLLERLIKYHMVDFLVWEKLLNPKTIKCQHGFLKTRSSLTNMLCVLEDKREISSK